MASYIYQTFGKSKDNSVVYCVKLEQGAHILHWTCNNRKESIELRDALLKSKNLDISEA